VRSLATLIDPHPAIHIITSPNFLDEIPADEATRRDWNRRLSDSPLANGLYLSRSGRAAAFYVPVVREADRGAVVSRLEAIVQQGSHSFDLKLTGPVTAEVLLGRRVLADLVRLVPIMIAVIAGLLLFCTRCAGGVIVPMAAVVVVLVATLGLMGLTGTPITLATTILPVLLMTVAITDEVHLLERFSAHMQQPTHREPSAALAQALREVGQPIVVTSLTTAFGFLSFVLASIEPLRALGLFAAFGVLLAMGLTFTFVPALILSLPPAWFRPRRAADETTAQTAWFLRHPLLAALTAGALLFASVPGWRHLGVDDSWVENFDPQADLVSAERDWNREFWGSYRFDVVIEGAPVLFFHQREGLDLIERLERVIERAPHVGGAVSHHIAYQIAADNSHHGVPVEDLPADEVARLAHLVARVQQRTDVDHVLYRDGSAARVRAFVKSANYAKSHEIAAYLDDELGPLVAAAGLRSRYSGDLPVATAVVSAIIGDILRSLALALVGVALVLTYFLRRPGALGFALLPLATAIGILLGLMGMLGMSFGIATSMFFAVAIGVGVDFPVHLLAAYQRRREQGESKAAAIASAYAGAGRAIRWNAGILTLGFSVLCLSSLSPNRSLGILLSAAMLVCYFTTVLFAPATLRRFVG
jgi:predicted RND superfamily exporter protein